MLPICVRRFEGVETPARGDSWDATVSPKWCCWTQGKKEKNWSCLDLLHLCLIPALVGLKGESRSCLSSVFNNKNRSTSSFSSCIKHPFNVHYRLFLHFYSFCPHLEVFTKECGRKKRKRFLVDNKFSDDLPTC